MSSLIDSERNKAVIRRFVEDVQNNRDWSVYDELNDPDFVNLSPGAPADREGGKAYLRGFLGAFPDARIAIEDMIADGDQVVTKKTFAGTHTADLGDIPATGRRVEVQYVDIMRVRDGRIVEHWHALDQLSLFQQLGLAP